MTDPRTLADHIAIRALGDEYCLRLEVDTFEDWMELFTDDIVYEVHRRVLEGKEAVAAMLSQAPHGVHLPGAMRITLDGDRAETVQNYAFFGNDPQYSNRGWYFRSLVRTENGWKIKHMRVKINKETKAAAPG